RMYGTPSLDARSINLLASSNCCLRFCGSDSCIELELSTDEICKPRPATSFIDCSRRLELNSGQAGRSIFPSMPRSSTPVKPYSLAKSSTLFQFQAGQPSVENPIGRLALLLAWAFSGAANKCDGTVATPAAA